MANWCWILIFFISLQNSYHIFDGYSTFGILILKFGKILRKILIQTCPHGTDFSQNSGTSGIPTTHSFAMTRSIICDIGEIYLLLASMLVSYGSGLKKRLHSTHIYNIFSSSENYFGLIGKKI